MSETLVPEVLVLGSTGRVGQGIVAVLLEVGGTVLVAARGQGRSALFHVRFADEPGLETLLGTLADDGSAQVLTERIALRPHPLAAVVDAMGSAYNCGRVIDRDGDALLQALQTDMMPHVHAGRHVLLLRGGSHARRRVLVGSPAGFTPWAGYGETSITTAATRMYAQVIHQEAQALSVRPQLLEVCSPMCTPANAANACIEWPSALLVGRGLVSLLENCSDNRAIMRCDSRDASSA